jgi:hypothetical protein
VDENQAETRSLSLEYALLLKREERKVFMTEKRVGAVAGP